MGGIFDAFEVYNKNKHSSNQRMFGGASNTGGTKTDYVYSSEYHAPKNKKLDKNELLGPASDASKLDAKALQETAGVPHMVDVSKMSQGELNELMKSLRKGEPNNRVNF
ncbi:LAFA_0A03840g1_1 [Lachancea sp. 'fantastica']|nr:LAFA_0A03840g1_1 [Lachancea sp. 'fantastica']